MKKILIIEKDVNIADLFEIHLKDLGLSITKAYDGELGLSLATSNQYDLILLDTVLPKIDGIEVCRQIRAKKITTYILIFMAKPEKGDKLFGLKIGADDYLPKPFSIHLFIARIKKILHEIKTSKGNLKNSQA